MHATTFSIEFVQVLATHRFARISFIKFDQSCSTPNCSFINVVSCNKNVMSNQFSRNHSYFFVLLCLKSSGKSCFCHLRSMARIFSVITKKYNRRNPSHASKYLVALQKKIKQRRSKVIRHSLLI